MTQQQVKFFWNKLRFENYVAGRLTIDKGFFHSSVINFHYAIETSYKALIFEFNTNEIQKEYRKIKNTHSLLELHKFCTERLPSFSLEISSYYLNMLDLKFNRYPTQFIESRDSGGNGKRDHLSYGINDILYYDEVLIGLNSAIVEKTRDFGSDLIHRALSSADTYKGRVFFHSNRYALSLLDEYLLKARESGISYNENLCTHENLHRFKEMDFMFLESVKDMITVATYR